MVANIFATLPVPYTKGITGKANSAPNLNLLFNCLNASSLAVSFFSLSKPVPIKSNASISPIVPMSSAFITIAPPPKPPPIVMAANLSKPFGLFNCLALLAALVKLTLSTVLPYRLVLTALTNIGASCLAFILAYSIVFPVAFIATL